MNHIQTNQLLACLNMRRLPARLNVEQVAQLIGFQTHDIPLLVKAKLLTPLGGGARNSVKYFAACEIEQLRDDRRWLDKATKAVSRRATSSNSSTEPSSLEANRD
jgi:hypothetical protein